MAEIRRSPTGRPLPARPPRDRRKAERRGRRAEALAALALRLKGWRILARNMRNGAGEVDIIARRGTTLIFVEVKARLSETAALDAVSWTAQARIQSAGEHWLSRHPEHADCGWRCDVVTVTPWRWPVHHEDVWQ